jgi:MraZ protein
MFLGTYLVSVTSGKRTSIPVSFRRELGTDFILAKWYENCLVLVSGERFNALLERVTGGEQMIIDPVRDTEHFLFASAYQMEADEQGRIVIPDRLYEYAGLGEQVYFLGIGDRVEIWNKEIWDIKERKVAAEAAGNIQKLNDKTKHGLNETETKRKL